MRLRSILPAFAVTALAVCILFFACERADKKPEPITIAFSATTESVLAEVAYKKGYFLQEGLEVLPRKHPYGRRALEDMLAGHADFATVAETPIVFAILKGEAISIIATIESSNAGNAILARKGKGIRAIKDLKGKKIAVTRGTVSEFFLDALLGVNGITRTDVKTVDLKAEHVAEALARGDIDAASTFNPYTAIIQGVLRDRVVAFQDKDIYRWTFNLVAKQEFIKQKPAVVQKVLRALVRAEEFVRQDPTAAQALAAEFTGLDIGIFRAVWLEANFALSLDQSLILALEDESQWAINNKLTKATKVPNYLNSIYLDGLQVVKPDAVRILR